MIERHGEIEFDTATHRYSVNGRDVPSVTQALKAARLIDFSMIPQAVLLHAAQRGRLVHLALEYLDRGELDEETLDPQIAGYVEAGKRFYRESGFVVDRIECRIYNPTWGYAGTFDRTGWLGKQDTVLDWKTGLSLPAHELQLIGYALALPEPRKYRRLSVGLNDDGTYRMHEYEAAKFDRASRAFLAAVMCAQWRMENEKGFRIWEQ